MPTIGDFSPQHLAPCPSCGHCPTCGRGGYGFRPHNPWVPYPLYPVWYSEPSGTTITTTSGGSQ